MAIDDDPNILVAYKRSRLEHYTGVDGADADALPRRASHTDRETLQRAHDIHRDGVESVCEHLARQGLAYDHGYRGDVEETDGYDLIVAVGGDGTVLDLSHRIGEVPILAINSHPEESVGYFCAGVVDDFPSLLRRARDGSLPNFALARFHVAINDEQLSAPVLNDVLISHANPGAVSRYRIAAGNHEPEHQRSSGIWLSTPAGSTAAIRSAGGFVLPIGCRCLEYLVREPYPLPDRPYRIRQGVQPIRNRFEVRSEMQDGQIFVDGPHIQHSFAFGDHLHIDADAPPLRLFGLHVERRTD